MGVPITIGKLISESIAEYARIELKERWNFEKMLRIVCAFANNMDN